jgi:hypothetical protein
MRLARSRKSGLFHVTSNWNPHVIIATANQARPGDVRANDGTGIFEGSGELLYAPDAKNAGASKVVRFAGLGTGIARERDCRPESAFGLAGGVADEDRKRSSKAVRELLFSMPPEPPEAHLLVRSSARAGAICDTKLLLINTDHTKTKQDGMNNNEILLKRNYNTTKSPTWIFFLKGEGDHK